MAGGSSANDQQSLKAFFQRLETLTAKGCAKISELKVCRDEAETKKIIQPDGAARRFAYRVDCKGISSCYGAVTKAIAAEVGHDSLAIFFKSVDAPGQRYVTSHIVFNLNGSASF